MYFPHFGNSIPPHTTNFKFSAPRGMQKVFPKGAKISVAFSQKILYNIQANQVQPSSSGAAFGRGAENRQPFSPAGNFSLWLQPFSVAFAMLCVKAHLTTTATIFFSVSISYPGLAKFGIALGLGVPWRYPGQGKVKRRKALRCLRLRDFPRLLKAA